MEAIDIFICIQINLPFIQMRDNRFRKIGFLHFFRRPKNEILPRIHMCITEVIILCSRFFKEYNFKEDQETPNSK